jgi:hypothetical protein
VAVLIGKPTGIDWTLIVGVGFVVARVGSRVLGLDRQWTKFVVACTIFQNVCDGFSRRLTLDKCPADCDCNVTGANLVGFSL